MTSLGWMSKESAWYMHHHPMLMLEGGSDLLQLLAFAGSFLCPRFIATFTSCFCGQYSAEHTCPASMHAAVI